MQVADKMRFDGKCDEAQRLYNEAIQLDRSHVCAYTGIGWCDGIRGQKQAGMEQMNRTVDMFPEDAKALIERGIYATNINRIDLAEADADRAIRLSYCAQAYELRAYCFLNGARISRRSTTSIWPLRYFPDSANAYKLRARAHRGLGNHAQANADDAKAKQFGDGQQ